MADDKNLQYDCIVIGAGMSGGWAAKEFCDNGFKTLLLERGPDVKHLVDYPTTNKKPWEFPLRGNMPKEITDANPSISRCYAFKEDAAHFFVKDTDHVYGQDKPFDWIRGYQVGGKSIMWARQVQRWSDYDFEGPKRDGFAVDWPIRYADLEEWYSYVEKFVGVSGNKDGIDTVPDGEFLKAWELNCVEKHFQKSLNENYKDRKLIYARCAHITEQKEIFTKQGRGTCQNRDLCQRGCPFGGYFNANSTLIPWAERTGNLTLKADSIVESIIYDEETKGASGVQVIDAKTKEKTTYSAKIIFVNAATINTNAILLNSKSTRFPSGLGNDSGTLGKYVGFHNYRGIISATHDGFKEFKSEGKRPTSSYIPRFRNVYKQETDFIRGYAVSFGAGRSKWVNSDGTGQELQDNLMADKEYGSWGVWSRMMGETIPREDGQVTLDPIKKDEYGIPQPNISVGYDENDEKMLEDYFTEFTIMLEKAGFKNIVKEDTKQAPGLDIHEMGGVRMGRDPKTSMLNKWNQLHACPNVFVTDGACMTSMSTQNPSLTFMALTARAANYAIDKLKKDEF